MNFVLKQIRVKQELVDKAIEIANRQGKNFSEFVRELIWQEVRREQKQKASGYAEY